MLSQTPGLLRSERRIHSWFKFYRCQKHYLICDVCEDTITVLCLLHTSMDVPGRLLELEPALREEIETLHQALREKDS